MIDEINGRTLEEIKKGLECRTRSNRYCNTVRCAECDVCVPRYTVSDVCTDALTLIQLLESAQPKWISVDADQKPMHGKEYLCVCSLPDDPEHKWDWVMVLRWYAYGTNGYVDRPHFTDEGLNGMTVTHWMSLPELPKGG